MTGSPTLAERMRQIRKSSSAIKFVSLAIVDPYHNPSAVEIRAEGDVASNPPAVSRAPFRIGLGWTELAKEAPESF